MHRKEGISAREGGNKCTRKRGYVHGKEGINARE